MPEERWAGFLRVATAVLVPSKAKVPITYEYDNIFHYFIETNLDDISLLFVAFLSISMHLHAAFIFYLYI